MPQIALAVRRTMASVGSSICGSPDVFESYVTDSVEHYGFHWRASFRRVPPAGRKGSTEGPRVVAGVVFAAAVDGEALSARAMVRYRRLTYRYTTVVAGGRVPAVSGYWPSARWRVLAEPRWRPEMDVYETATAVTVTIELAGVDPDRLEVLLFDDALVVDGERRLPPEEGPGTYRAVEIRQGPFRVEVPLQAPIDAAGVEARYDHGLLRIVLPHADAGSEDRAS